MDKKHYVRHDVWHTDGSHDSGLTTNLRTNEGVNWQVRNLGEQNLSAISFISITTDRASPSASDTSLPGEETTDGLSRQNATFSHTADQSRYTQTATWQYTGSSTKTIHKAGQVHDSARTQQTQSSDTLFLETVLGSDAVLDSNDTLEIQWGVSV